MVPSYVVIALVDLLWLVQTTLLASVLVAIVPSRQCSGAMLDLVCSMQEHIFVPVHMHVDNLAVVHKMQQRWANNSEQRTVPVAASLLTS